MPWGADGYSPLDLSLLDPHYGTVRDWQNTIDALHDSGMLVTSARDLLENGLMCVFFSTLHSRISKRISNRLYRT
jgi:hypothetical protein